MKKRALTLQQAVWVTLAITTIIGIIIGIVLGGIIL